MGMQRGTAALEKREEIPPKIKHRTITWFSNPTSGCRAKWVESKTSRDLCTPHSKRHCSPQLRGGRERQTNVVRSYSDTWSSLEKENPHSATTWANLKDITLREISQSQEAKYCMIPLTHLQQSKSQRHEGGYQGPGDSLPELCVTAIWVHVTLLNCALKNG